MQVHREPDLFGRIIRRIAAPNHFIFVNVDAKYPYFERFKAEAEGLPNIIFTKRINVMHGGFSQVACTLEQLEELYAKVPDFTYMHTISGQDYPCVTTELFDAFFEGNTRSYMMLDTKEEQAEWCMDKYSKRIEKWYFDDWFNRPWMWKLHLKGFISRPMRLVKRPYGDMHAIWGGWNWFSLHRSVVDYFLKFVEANPRYLKRFHLTNCCDELVFATMLYPHLTELNIENRNSKRYVNWHSPRRKTNAPLLLNENEYEDVVKSGAFFCRKVSLPESAKLLEMLDARCGWQGL